MTEKKTESNKRFPQNESQRAQRNGTKHANAEFKRQKSSRK